MSKKHIKILYFGRLAEITKKNEELFEVNHNETVGEVVSTISELYTELNKHSFKIALNQKLVQPDELLNNATEIALLPPFSGG